VADVDRVAVVTGAARGIGRAIAIAVASAGMNVVLTARQHSLDVLHGVASDIEDLGRKTAVVPMDLTDPPSIRQAANAAIEQFGRIDVLVNNASISGPSKPFVDLAKEDWEETFDVNVTGTFLTCQAFLPTMIRQRNGVIIVIGSMSSKKPVLNRSPYIASKAALTGLVRSLAHELGPIGIRANLISPGPVEGERLDWVIEQLARARGVDPSEACRDLKRMSPLGRFVSPADVASIVVFLASDAAAAVTGEEVNVNAGAAMC
jgi:NAD(P)-dependent dehydrogenase (short-subunit alcohol dehydrogenase family)